jgi:hypothetical protein
MTENVLPFPKPHRPSRDLSDAERREEKAQRRDADQRRLYAEEIERKLAAEGRDRKRGPTLSDSDKIQVARNLQRILIDSDKSGVDRKDILISAVLSNPYQSSTRFLYQYTLPDQLESEQKKKRIKRLSKVAKNYLSIAQSVGRLMERGEFWFVSDLFRNTEFDVRLVAKPKYEWLHMIQDLIEKLSNWVVREHHGLEGYLRDLECGYLGWHPSLGFGRFDSLHLGGPVLIYDRGAKYMGYLGFVPTVHLYDEFLGAQSFENVAAFREGDSVAEHLQGRTFDEFYEESIVRTTVAVYREIHLGIAPFGEERSWHACFEKRLRFRIHAGDAHFSTYDPFANVWDTSHSPAIRARSGEITAACDDIRVDLPEDWFGQVPFDEDFIDEADERLGMAFFYERFDLTSVKKYVGTPKYIDNIELNDWWGEDVRDIECKDEHDKWYDESEWHFTWDLSMPLTCPLGVIGRAVEQNLIYESEPDRRLDDRLFAAVARKVKEASSTKAEMEQDREHRIEALKRRWEDP